VKASNLFNYAVAHRNQPLAMASAHVCRGVLDKLDCMTQIRGNLTPCVTLIAYINVCITIGVRRR
jgi:hypothetical protein